MNKNLDRLTAQRALDISPFIVMEILEKAQAMEARGHKVVHMEIGEPDFQTPEVVKEAAAEALRQDLTKYTHSLGLPELRTAISQSFKREYNVDIDPKRVIVTTGTSAGVLLTFAALVNPGEEVILTDPGYPCYPKFLSLVGGKPVYIGLREEDGWQVSITDLASAISSKTKCVMIKSPTNPT
ncbi:hypothetical protein LCGC14_3102270 [marine sediment metagenome]|uniref:Aminotransferase class I/classII large domain-containing protein n=1 Tax=marine sediment metagenome TaxID=412755 RepID=A0A0F8YXG6_9ZZZZ